MSPAEASARRASVRQNPPQWQAVEYAGKIAHRTLGTPAKGRVLGAFRRSAYLTFPGLDMVCIGARSIGLGPLNALHDGRDALLESVRRDDPVSIEGHILAIGVDLMFDLQSMQRWNPQPVAICEPVILERGPGLLRAELERRQSKNGLAPLIPGFCTPLGAAQYPQTWDEPLLNVAAQRLQVLREWLAVAHEVIAPPLAPVAALLGLGPGLTPSGDDALAGAMIALRSLGADRAAAQIAEAVLLQAERRTGAISVAHLQCAAEGQGSEAIHQVIAAVATADAPAITRALSRLGQLGHSSGWDSLAGVAIGVSSLSRVYSR